MSPMFAEKPSIFFQPARRVASVASAGLALEPNITTAFTLRGINLGRGDTHTYTTQYRDHSGMFPGSVCAAKRSAGIIPGCLRDPFVL